MQSRKNGLGVKVKITLLLAVFGSLALTACDGSDNPGATGAMAPSSTMAASATGPAASTSAQGASCGNSLMTVSAQANIFGAGSDFAPGPGGGGGGVVPPSLDLQEGASVVTFPTVTGKVTARMGALAYNGANGDGKGKTDITSYSGISGIVDGRHGMFLVGVFLTDDPPSNVAPRRLDFTKHERFRTLAPRVGQTFFIGDGKERSFSVPKGATRLFLGFADAFSLGEAASQGNYQGRPGYYDNNDGHLCVAAGIEPE
jgi:hypothetical protein